jgi:hypothetical protein
MPVIDMAARAAGARHRGPDFGAISEDQGPDVIAAQVEAVYAEYERARAVAPAGRAGLPLPECGTRPPGGGRP